MASLKDIAVMTGLSLSTVSRALNEDPRISATTRKRVLEAAGKVNYEPNVQAKVLAGRPARVIGFMASQVRYNWDEQVMRGVEDAAKAAGYRVLISLHYDDMARIEPYRQLLDQPIFDAVIVGWSGWAWRHGTPFPKPVVYVDLWPEQFGGGHVITSDHAMAAALMVDMFVEKGVSRVTIFGHCSRNTVECARAEQLRVAAEARGLPYTQVDPSKEPLVALAARLSPDDALVVEAGSDWVNESELAGAPVSKAFAAFFDARSTELARIFPLAAVVEQDHFTMGRQAVGTIIDCLGGRRCEPIQYVPVTIRELRPFSPVNAK